MARYLGEENIILILEHPEEAGYLKSLDMEPLYQVRPDPSLAGYVELHHLASTNIKNLLYLFWSLLRLFLLSCRHGLATITISVVEPEKYTYLLWLPFLRVNYILHTEPPEVMNQSTVAIFNRRLGNLKTLTTVSEDMKRVICRNWSIKPSKQQYVHVVYNCILEPGKKVSPVSGGRAGKLVTTMGHVSKRKNPFIWLETAKLVTGQHPDVAFLWLGEGELLNYFKTISENYPRITFAGLAVDTQVHLEKTDVYYQPSLEEPHGIAVLEAMYNRLPCVVSNTGGLPESVQDGYNGIVVGPVNTSEHVAALVKLLNEHQLSALYGHNSWLRYQDLFTYGQFKKNMDLIYGVRS